MKKVIIVFVICMVLIGVTFFILNNPNISENIVGKFENVMDQTFGAKETAYDENFVVNALGIKQNSYYFAKLNDNQKAIYTSMANGIRDLKTNIKLQGYEYTDVDQAMKDVEEALHKFLLDHPEVFYLEDKYTIATPGGLMNNKVSVNVSYSVANKEELEKQLNTITESAKAMFEQAGIQEGKDFLNEVAIHDIVANQVSYFDYNDTSEIPRDCHTIYGAFINKKAVCDGLSKAVQLLLNMANVNSILVTGTLNNEAHAWNMVQLEDGWYHLDITSDKSVKREEGSVTTHAYFNITTDTLKTTHGIDEPQILPQATNTKYNYYNQLGKKITVSDNFSAKLKGIIDQNKDSKLVEFEAEGISDVPNKIIDVLRNGKYTRYLGSAATKFVYYNILDVYIMFANE